MTSDTPLAQQPSFQNQDAPLSRQDTMLSQSWRRFRRNRMALVCGAIAVLFILIAILAPLLAPYRYDYQDLNAVNLGPSLEHLFGTDELGGDLFSQVLYSLQTDLGIVAMLVLLTSMIGVTVGAMSGYCGGWVDTVLMRITDFFLSIPYLFFAIFLAATLKPRLNEGFIWLAVHYRPFHAITTTQIINIALVLLVLGLLDWPGRARLTRGQVLALKNREFVDAVRVLGATDSQILWRHILPNALTPIIVAASMSIGDLLISASALSFLGLGVQPPAVSLGLLLNTAVRSPDSFTNYPQRLIGPAFVLALLIFAFNFVGDGLNDALNPKRG